MKLKIFISIILLTIFIYTTYSQQKLKLYKTFPDYDSSIEGEYLIQPRHTSSDLSEHISGILHLFAE